MKHTFAVAIAVALLAPGSSALFGQISNLSIPPTSTSYQLVSQMFVTRTQSYYTFQAVLVNAGPALPSVVATATSLSPNVTVVAGQGTLDFSPVPANGRAVSTNTFTILVSGVTFDGSQISWSFNSPVANPGPNQTVPVLSTVTLNGGGSTNPSGIGSLTYSWSIQSAPAGSLATLSNASNVIASLVPDLLGNYVVALTVNNGSLANTSTVTVSTTDVPPAANAGANQTVSPGTLVTLNGTKSSDVNGQPLSYTWSFLTIPSGSAAVLAGIRSPTPTFTVDKPGSYIVGLVVNDGTLSSAQSTVTVSTGNSPPVAVATAMPQVTVVNSLVQLDGSKSTDVDRNPLTYAWSLNTTQAPQSHATLSNPNIVNPTFTADVAGTYVAQLIVNDGTISSPPATVTVTTNTVLAPTANAGSSQTVTVGSIVQLQGSGTDPQSLPLSYTWSLPTVPAGSTAALSAANTQNPTFVADLPGTYVPQLVVSNGFLASSPATVTITSSPVLPVAVPTTATPSVPVGTTVSLSGSSSFDSAQVPITAYMWSLSVPTGSTTTLAGANTEFPTFVPDVAGTYVAQLIVKAQSVSSVPATVSISAGTMTIGLTPNPLNLPNTPEALTITLSPGAGATPVNVTLSGYDPSIVSPQSNVVTIPANTASANVTVDPLKQGSTSITATAPGYQTNTIPVTVAVPSISVTFDNNATSVAVGQTIGATITLNTPAPQPFGTSVTIIDVVDHDSGGMPGLVTFNTPSVQIPGGSTTGRFTLTGAESGPAEIQIGSAGYARLNFILFSVLPSAVVLPKNLVVPAGQSVPLNVQLSTPAPAGGATILLQSNNTATLTVSPGVIAISPGATTPAVPPQVTGVASGSTSITGTASGFTSDTEIVSVTNALIVVPCPTITSGEVNVPFNTQILPATGTAPYTFSIVGTLPAGLTLTPSGAIMGTPTSAGSFSVKVTDNNGASGTSCLISISPPPSVICPTTTSGTVGAAFSSGPLTVTGGTMPYSYLIAGTLPSGLTLNTSNGAVSGTPATTGSFSIQVKDVRGVLAGTSCPITISSAAQLSLACPSAASFQVGVPVNSPALAVNGGSAPYTFSVASGTLPPGLTLNSLTGAIAGTASAPGAFTIQVKDATGVAAASTCPFTVVSASGLVITTTSLPQGMSGTPYSFQPMTSGGTLPFVWTITGLPRSFNFNASTGLIGGTSGSGTFTITISVTDSGNPRQTATTTLPLVIGPTSLGFATASPLPNATVDMFYVAQIFASGGQTPYHFSVSNLPPWLTLDVSGSLCGAAGSICGTPTASFSGLNSFTVTVTDSSPVAQTVSQGFSLTVATQGRAGR